MGNFRDLSGNNLAGVTVNQSRIDRVTTDATTNGRLIGAGPGTVEGYDFSNQAGTPRYIKLYDKATTPVVGTDIPVMTIGIPANQTVRHTLNDEVLSFRNGLGIGITTGLLDNDTGVTAVGDVLGNIMYDS
jgi:hypothetical protein